MVENSAIVAAHPDDEMLWFSSILASVGKIIICMVGSQSKPELGPAREASMRHYPLPNLVSLHIDQADTLGSSADWANPVLTGYGIAMPRRPELSKRNKANYLANNDSILGAPEPGGHFPLKFIQVNVPAEKKSFLKRFFSARRCL